MHDCRSWSQWSSGSTLACGARHPRIESCCRQKFLCFSRKSLQYAAFGMDYTLTAVPRSTRPSTLRGTVQRYNLMVEYWYKLRWANVPPVEAYRRTHRSSLQSVLRVGSHLAVTNFRPYDPKWTFVYGWCRIDGTINYHRRHHHQLLVTFIWKILHHFLSNFLHISWMLCSSCETSFGSCPRSYSSERDTWSLNPIFLQKL